MALNLIHIDTCEGKKELLLFTPANKPDAYLFSTDAVEHCEAEHQLLEGCEYEYRFEDINICFDDNPIIRPSQDTKESRGRIVTGNYVGTLHLKIKNNQDEYIGVIDFEVRSKKTSYREDYRKMLADITAYYTELLMISSSPVTQRFEPSDEDESITLYQKFAFVKSVIDSEDFEDAIHKILYNPVRKWTETTIEKPISAVKRIGRSAMKQIATAYNRIELDTDIVIDGGVSSVPRQLKVPYKRDTIDTPENRFVKYVLTSFHAFCSGLQDLKHAADNQRLINEATACCTKLENMLQDGFFKEISQPQFIALNSPVLQKREGYREVLQAWTIFDMAAKLTWKGGENVYRAGMRNVAALYEYWLFFKLLELISEKFELNPKEKSALVHLDKDGINLDLKQGRMIMVGGVFKSKHRDLNVRFYYNRTFAHNNRINERGSWTTTMRPDYTLSIWTGDVSEAEAEKQNTIVHIHFDAKYRVEQIMLLNDYDNREFNDDAVDDELSEVLNDIKQDEQIGVYKRADLLKMHAYNDAIRRTGGSYVLYPGTNEKALRGFHEIIPGLGAFPVNPNSFEEDSVAIKKFIDDLVSHFLNRVSQREIRAYNDFETFKNKPNAMLYERMVEPYGENRHMIPSMTNVIIGYCKDENHLKWILENKRYNTRTGTQNGSLRLNDKITTAKYLLLRTEGDNNQTLVRLNDKGPRIMSKEDLMRLAKWNTRELYQPSNDYYIVFDISENAIEKEYQNIEWDFARMRKDKTLFDGRLSGVPIGISMAELMKYKKRIIK